MVKESRVKNKIDVSKEYKPHEIQPNISKEQLEENQLERAKSFDKFLKGLK